MCVFPCKVKDQSWASSSIAFRLSPTGSWSWLISYTSWPANPKTSCLFFPGAGITGANHLEWLLTLVLQIHAEVPVHVQWAVYQWIQHLSPWFKHLEAHFAWLRSGNKITHLFVSLDGLGECVCRKTQETSRHWSVRLQCDFSCGAGTGAFRSRSIFYIWESAFWISTFADI